MWNCIECTRIDNLERKPNGKQIKAEVWMSLIHGSSGLIYFSHQFKPTFIEAGMLADAEGTGMIVNDDCGPRSLVGLRRPHADLSRRSRLHLA